MDKYYGFDLGDAESAIAVLPGTGQKEGIPQILAVGGEKSIITAYARATDGTIQIGEKACYLADAVKRALRFKGRFLSDPQTDADVTSFAGGILGTLYAQGDLDKEEETCFYIGCPAGWDPNTRERYRAIFERAGYPPVKIVSESRAALISACQSKHLQVGYDILSKLVLVVDIGSSTTDFAYINGGKEVQMQTAGEVALGGGIMDELLLEKAVRESEEEEKIREVFAQSEPWKNYCEFAARALKERYFADEAYWKEHDLSTTVMIRYDRPLRLTIRMDEETAEMLSEGKSEFLGGRSFHAVFSQSLKDVRDQIGPRRPELVFLTGGVSGHPKVREWCAKAFPESVIITGTEPEFSVARGLAWSGRIDGELKLFRSELDELVGSSKVENIVAAWIPDLYREAVSVLVEPMLREVAVPVFHRWRSGQIRRLSDTDQEMERGMREFLQSDQARKLLEKTITVWLKPVAEALEEMTIPICLRHNVPYRALSLRSYLSASDMEVEIDARKVFAVGELTWLIDSLISVVIGLLCGGSGVALLSGGPAGIIAGTAVSMIVLLLGKGKMEKTLLHADIPVFMRRMIPARSFENRMASMCAQVRKKLYQSLEQDKNDEITARMTNDIAQQIEQCLMKMAEVVEIPLGT